jgi:predicted amidophosphoribosyltransferase
VKNNKGCINESCEAYKEKIKYKDSETYCSRCGSQLAYVCKKCHRQLSSNNDKNCIRCRAEIEDRRKRIQNAGGKFLGVMIAGGGVLIQVADKLRSSKEE